VKAGFVILDFIVVVEGGGFLPFFMWAFGRFYGSSLTNDNSDTTVRQLYY